ncbi:MAG: hypothetical protein OEZ13_06845 [Spirochaetia bacterium]|nr:hypothetical protein [Spirochaetia bacterium]
MRIYLTLFIILFSLNSIEASSKKRFSDQYYFIIENEIEPDEKYNLLNSILNKITKKNKIKITNHLLEDSLPKALPDFLQEIKDKPKKIFILTRASFPREYSGVFKRDKYIDSLKKTARLIDEKYKYQIIFIQYQRNTLHFISNFADIFSEYRIIEEKNIFDIIKILRPQTEITNAGEIKISDNKKKFSYPKIKLFNYECFSGAKDPESFRHFQINYTTKRDIEAQILTEAQIEKYKIQFGQKACVLDIYSYAQKRRIYSVIFFEFIRPKITASKKRIFGHFSTGEKVSSQKIEIKSDISLSDAEVIIEEIYVEGSRPDFFSENKKWIYLSNKNIYYVPDVKNNPKKYTFDNHKNEIILTYKAAQGSSFEGVLKIKADENITYFEVPVILKSQISLRSLFDKTKGQRIYILIATLSFIAIAIIIFLRLSRKKKRIKEGIQGSFSMLLKPGDVYDIRENDNPFNCPITYLNNGFRISYENEALTLNISGKAKLTFDIKDLSANSIQENINLKWSVELSAASFSNEDKDAKLIRLRLLFEKPQ